PEGLYWRVRSVWSGRGGEAPRTTRPTPVFAVARAAPPPAPRASGALLLEVRGISKAFLGLQALSEVSFDVRGGEILGIIGPNGAGKTTLFNVLNGFLLPDRGEVRWLGAPITGLEPHEICRRGIGRTFQVMRVFPRLTVEENVMVGAFVREGAPDRARARAQGALARMGLGDRAGLVAPGLTPPEVRLVAPGRGLATAPRLVLLDEPLA